MGPLFIGRFSNGLKTVFNTRKYLVKTQKDFEKNIILKHVEMLTKCLNFFPWNQKLSSNFVSYLRNQQGYTGNGACARIKTGKIGRKTMNKINTGSFAKKKS